jgi:RNA polymerase sigma-70 factor (ECF subfamily)
VKEVKYMKSQSDTLFTTLIADNKEDFYRLAYSYVKNEHDALDTVSEAIYKGYKSLSHLKEDKFMKTWFYRILINESISTVRKRKNLVYNSDIIENQTVETKDYLDLHDAIDTLSEKYKTVIILKYFKALKIREIGEILKVNENTIKTRIKRALVQLKEVMEVELYG